MSNLSDNIKHIVFLMLENRSFDNLLGWCYDGVSEPSVNSIPPVLGAGFHGLSKVLLGIFKQPLKRSFHDPESHPIVRGVQGNYFPNMTPIVDPEESFEPVTKQLFGTGSLSEPPQMLGFLQNFYDHSGGWTGTYEQILDTYDPFANPPQAPIINFLARNFGVSDMWFSSIPSQTSINRAFSLTGNSVGWKTKPPSPLWAMVDNWYYDSEYTPAQFVGPTIFDVLYDNHLKKLNTPDDWRIYYSNVWPPMGIGSNSYTYQMFPTLQKTLADLGDRAKQMNKPISEFYTDLANGDLPAFSYLEPDYTLAVFGKVGYQGNDYHPPGDITDGEQFLADLYTKITASPLWKDILFIISFDEHGGTFDHFAPLSGAIDPSPQYDPTTYEHDFKFDRFGVRVPTIFVSPWVQKNTVIRSSTNVPFDHTSLLRTLLDWFGLGSLNSGSTPVLGKRTAAAPSFAPVISSTRRTDIPKLPPITEPDLSQVGARTNGQYNATIAIIAARNLAAQRGLLADRFVPAIVARHRPMYPDNSQLVTFEGQAFADRVILSYTRSVLSTAPDGSRRVTPVELDTVVKTCDPRGARASIRCTHTMPAPFPPSSLITYTATAVFANGASSKEVYSFAAGDYPWPRDPIPIRLKGNPTSKLDTVFIPDKNLPMGTFLDHLDEVVDVYFHYAPLLFWRGLHNFYISDMAGSYGPQCTWDGPPNLTELRAVADALVFLHDTEVRNCANIPRISATFGTATIDKKGLVHESAHAWFTVEDEYCCNTRYRKQPCVPNIYCSLADCVADASNLFYPSSYCIQLSGGGTTKNVWRIDPKGEPDEDGPPCIMGPNQNRETSVFDNACLRRLTWRYRKCLDGTCMSDPPCRGDPCPP